MAEVVQDLSRPVLVKAIEANIFEQLPIWAQLKLKGVETYDRQDVKWFITGVPHPLFNGVLFARFPPDEIDERIEATLRHFRSRNLPMSWWVGPSTRPADLGKRLEAHGLTHASDPPGMAADLLALNEDLPTPSELLVERVGNTKALKKWLHSVAICFQLPDSAANFYFDVFASLGFGSDSPWLHYVGYLKGEPVACSSVFLGAGVAGVYCVGTVPEARRQGIGTAVTLAPLRDARGMGYRVGILHSSEESFNVYRQLGFAEYCKLSIYVWAGEKTQI